MNTYRCICVPFGDEGLQDLELVLEVRGFGNVVQVVHRRTSDGCVSGHVEGEGEQGCESRVY